MSNPRGLIDATIRLLQQTADSITGSNQESSKTFLFHWLLLFLLLHTIMEVEEAVKRRWLFP